MLCPYCQENVDAFPPAASGSGLRCPQCGDEEVPRLYPLDYGTHPAVPVCIFGPGGHGKSVYIDALLHHLETRIQWPRFSQQWMSQADMAVTRERLRAVREHGALPQFTERVFPRPQVLRLRNVPRVGGCQLLFFDTSGETFSDVAYFTEQGRYIRAARAVVWLISLTDLEYPQQLSDLMTVYAEAMRAMGGDPKQQTVIVTLTKGDRFFNDPSLPASAREFLENDELNPAGDAWRRLARMSDDLESWLRGRGHANVVNLLPDLFRAARFCIVSAQGAEADAESNLLALDLMPRGVLAPLFWLWRETLPTVAVEADRREATYFSLLDAIAGAPEGAVLRLGAGTYTLPRRVEISKPLILVGGGPNLTTIQCDDEKFVIGAAPTAGTVTLSGLTIRHLGEKPADVVRAFRGSLLLQECDVTGGLTGGETVPGDGVLALREAEVTVRKGFIYGNQGNGLAARDQAKVAAHETSLVENRRAGLYARGALAEAHGCMLSKNGREGAALGGNSRCVLTKNRCQQNGRSGFVLRDTCLVELRGNHCGTNKEHGISCRHRAVVSAENNACIHNEASGVSVQDGVSGVFHQTTCQQNGLHGIEIGGEASPTLTENDCRENGEAGIRYTGRAAGDCDRNRCRENAGDGMHVTDSAAPKLTGNQVLDNGGHGVVVTPPARPVVGPKNAAGGNARGDTKPATLFRKGWFG